MASHFAEETHNRTTVGRNGVPSAPPRCDDFSGFGSEVIERRYVEENLRCELGHGEPRQFAVPVGIPVQVGPVREFNLQNSHKPIRIEFLPLQGGVPGSRDPGRPTVFSLDSRFASPRVREARVPANQDAIHEENNLRCTVEETADVLP